MVAVSEKKNTQDGKWAENPNGKVSARWVGEILEVTFRSKKVEKPLVVFHKTISAEGKLLIEVETAGKRHRQVWRKG